MTSTHLAALRRLLLDDASAFADAAVAIADTLEAAAQLPASISPAPFQAITQAVQLHKSTGAYSGPPPEEAQLQ